MRLPLFAAYTKCEYCGYDLSMTGMISEDMIYDFADDKKIIACTRCETRRYVARDWVRLGDDEVETLIVDTLED